jgi:hypothetical protein
VSRGRRAAADESSRSGPLRPREAAAFCGIRRTKPVLADENQP